MTADHLWEDQVAGRCRGCGHSLDVHRAVVRLPGKGWGLDATPSHCHQMGCKCPGWSR